MPDACRLLALYNQSVENTGISGLDTADTIAWRAEMVEKQIRARGIVDERVLQTLLRVPRHVFIPQELIDESYQDRPLPIGQFQTISQPYIVALMTETLNLKGHEKVLEVGTGSGYQAAILAHLAKEICTIDRLEELSMKARTTIERLGIDNIRFYVGDGSLGLPEEAPFDAIMVTAAAPRIPAALTAQLSIGGRLILPTGDRWQQQLKRILRTEDGFEEETILAVAFVPLIGAQGWQESSFD